MKKAHASLLLAMASAGSALRRFSYDYLLRMVNLVARVPLIQNKKPSPSAKQLGVSRSLRILDLAFSTMASRRDSLRPHQKVKGGRIRSEQCKILYNEK